MAAHEMEPSASVKRFHSELKPKHTIFLSHSGEEKSFVEQLCVDLKRVNQSPFFDQDSDSLPKGERFTSLIFEAAEHCQLAVVVLSKGYLSSKWPMLELSAFLKAKKTKNPNLKLFPLFYKLSPSDLDARKVETEWVESWKRLVEGGEVQEKEVSLWSEAVKSLVAAKNEEMERERALKEQLVQGEVEAEEFSKVFGEAVRELRPFNGLEFRKYGNSEVKYRDAVVDEICRCVPPMMKMDTEKIRGYRRLCEKISSMFEEVVCEEGSSNIYNHAPLYLGLYGMGGVGKTTLCLAMCSYFQEEFRGRVCHIELQMDNSRDRMERLKHAIQQLASFDNRVVEMITTEAQGLACLKEQLRDQPPVFLAVDNVGDSLSSLDEAQAYLDAGLANGSKVLVTSRSQTILKSILKEAKYCKPIPRLEEMEAAEVFLSVAAPGLSLSSLPPCERGIVEACLGECQFGDDGYPSRQYHPLVLKALGAYFHDIDGDGNVVSWEVALREENKLQTSRESKDMNDILGLNYKTLDDMQKMIFLDVALLFNMRFGTDSVYITAMDFTWEWWDRMTPYKWQVSFIASLHGISPLTAGMQVKILQRKSLINESSRTLIMHDLYIEFALMLIGKEGSKERGWWVGHLEKNIGDIPGLKRLLVSFGKSELCRVPKYVEECRHLIFLALECYGDSFKSRGTLDLGVLNSLRVLLIYNCGLENIVCSCNDSSNGLSCLMGNEGCLSELQIVKVINDTVKSVPFLRHCGNLQSLSLSFCNLNPFDFMQDGIWFLKYLKKLEALRLYCIFSEDHEMSMGVFYEILRGTSTLKNLKVLEFQLTYNDILPDSEYPGMINLSLLESLSSLSILSLMYLPEFIRELKGLEQLYQLTTLNLMGSKGLLKLPDLPLLPNLEQVCVNRCCSLEDPMALLWKFRDISIDDYCKGGDDEDHNHKCLEPQCKSIWCKVCVDHHLECGCLNEDYDYCAICHHQAYDRCILPLGHEYICKLCKIRFKVSDTSSLVEECGEG